MSMARTIKLLGWGPRAKRQLDDIRQEELELTKRYKFTELLTGHLKYPHSCITHFLVCDFALLSAFSYPSSP
jgi:hypothetical protein